MKKFLYILSLLTSFAIASERAEDLEIMDSEVAENSYESLDFVDYHGKTMTRSIDTDKLILKNLNIRDLARLAATDKSRNEFIQPILNHLKIIRSNYALIMANLLTGNSLKGSIPQNWNVDLESVACLSAIPIFKMCDSTCSQHIAAFFERFFNKPIRTERNISNLTDNDVISLNTDQLKRNICTFSTKVWIYPNICLILDVEGDQNEVFNLADNDIPRTLKHLYIANTTGNVTSIGNNFLYTFPGLTHIDLTPLRNVTSIGGRFLFCCRGLQNIIISENWPHELKIPEPLRKKCLSSKIKCNIM